MLSLILFFLLVVYGCLYSAYHFDVKEIENELKKEHSALYNLTTRQFAKYVYWSRLETEWWMFKKSFKYALKARVPAVKGYWNIITDKYWNVLPTVKMVVECVNGTWSVVVELNWWNRWFAVEFTWENYARYANPSQHGVMWVDKEPTKAPNWQRFEDALKGGCDE